MSKKQTFTTIVENVLPRESILNVVKNNDYLSNILKRSTFNIIEWLAEYNLIKNSMNCAKCGERMKLICCVQVCELFCWQCPKPCGNRKSIRNGSFFEDSKMFIIKQLRILYLWGMNSPQDVIAFEVGMNKNTMVEKTRNFREIC